MLKNLGFILLLVSLPALLLAAESQPKKKGYRTRTTEPQVIYLDAPREVTAETAKAQKPEASCLVCAKNQELMPTASISKDFGSVLFQGGLSYGYFVLDFLKPEAQVNYARGSSVNIESVLAGASVYLNKGQRLLPFASLDVGYGSVASAGTKRSSVFMTAPRAGVLFSITKRLGISASAEYQRWSGSSTGFGGTNHLRFPIGLSILF